MASWSRLTYPRRLFLWLLGYSLLMVACFVAFQYHREREFKEENINSRLQLLNTYIITELAEGHHPDSIRLDEFHPIDGLRVSVISPGGRMLYDNTLDTLPATNHLDRAEVRGALTRGSCYSVRRLSESDGVHYFYSARRAPDGCIVRTAVPYSLSLSALLRADYGFLRVMGLITVIMCILGYFATRRVGQHITRLNRFAENVENGRRITDTEPFPHDELGDISNHIVRLYARLQQAIHDRDAEHRAAMREQMEKERIKKQLTDNINHELKTPVASIRVCVETLLAHSEMDAPRRTQFLQRCLDGTDRLQRLLADVALLTRMTDGAPSVEMHPLNPAGVIEAVAADRRLIAEARGMKVNCDVNGEIRVNGNEALLETVFNNLIDNAVAYSGGSEVSIRLESMECGRAVITVADNGCGVDECHLQRLFERFYRIDKGRSRAAGGTGLGLSIVKNAVALHGGTVSVENRASGGLLFRITLPLCNS